MKNFLILFIFLALFNSCSDSTLNTENIPSVDIQTNAIDQSNCETISLLTLNGLSVNHYGFLHNAILESVHSNNYDFTLNNSLDYYLALNSYTEAAILNLNVSSEYLTISDIPTYNEANLYTSLSLADRINNSDDYGLRVTIVASKNMLNQIDDSVLSENARVIINNMLDEIESRSESINFQNYINQLSILNNSESIFIADVIVSITASSACYWNQFENNQMQGQSNFRIAPWLAAIIAKDCMGAIGGVWFHAIANAGDSGDAGEWGKAALGGAVTSSLGM